MARRVFGIPLGGILVFIAVVLVLLVLLNWGSILDAGESILEFTFRPDERVTSEVIVCTEDSTCTLVHSVVYSAVLLALVVTGFAYTTLLERKVVAYFQNRVGPNRVGPWGLLQPLADGIKLIFKEDIQPAQAYKVVYYLAPMVKVVPTLVVLAVIPLGPDIIIPWFAPALGGVWYRVPLGLADINIGVLWLLAITSIGTYGVVLAGWASNNKYSMLGGLRASAQMISYELSMGLAIAVPVMIVGSMSIGDIIDAQGGNPLEWFVFQNPLAAGILLIALVAETNRAPFDLPEAEQELTAGYMTEYSGMKFALFMMAEYLGMIAVSLIAVSLYFGGYHFILVDQFPILGPLVMIGKTILFLVGFVWLRATLPRIRYDRLMSLGWKILLPLAFIAVLWTAVAVVIGEEFGPVAYGVASAVIFAVIAVGSVFFLGRPEPEATEDEDLEWDPMITGERTGIAYALLQLVGGLIAIPFSLFNATVQGLEALAKLGEDEPEEESEDKTALPSKTGGGD